MSVRVDGGSMMDDGRTLGKVENGVGLMRLMGVTGKQRRHYCKYDLRTNLYSMYGITSR